MEGAEGEKRTRVSLNQEVEASVDDVAPLVRVVHGTALDVRPGNVLGQMEVQGVSSQLPLLPHVRQLHSDDLLRSAGLVNDEVATWKGKIDGRMERRETFIGCGARGRN